MAMKQNNENGQRWYHLPLTTGSFNGMPYRALGNSGLQAPLLGLGTWKMGRPETGDGARIPEKEALSILDAAHERGVCFWDTANRYNSASGNAERVIGEWFRQHSSLRRDIILCTKIGGAMDGGTPNHAGLGRKNILESVYACLERLQTSFIELLYFHFFDPKTPAEESLAAIEDLVRQRLIGYFAVSNFSPAQLDLFAAANRPGEIRTRIIAVQNQYDLLFGESEAQRGAMQYCTDHGMAFIPWSPLARGLLSGKYQPAVAARPGDRLFDEQALDPLQDPLVAKRLEALSACAAARHIPLNQLVIAYMKQLPAMGPLIIASSSVSQLHSNADGALLELEAPLLLEIKKILS